MKFFHLSKRFSSSSLLLASHQQIDFETRFASTVTTLLLCSFADDRLQIALHIPGSNNLSMHLPIVVGTVPYRPAIARPPNDGFCGLHYLPVVPPPYRENPTPPPPIEG
jgi:hypothetical protein